MGLDGTWCEVRTVPFLEASLLGLSLNETESSVVFAAEEPPCGDEFTKTRFASNDSSSSSGPPRFDGIAGVAAIDGSLIATLTSNELEFAFPDSVQCGLIFDAFLSETILSCFAIDREHFLVSAPGFTRVVSVSEASSTVSVVSIEGEVAVVQPQSVPRTILCDVTERYAIRSDVETIFFFKKSDKTVIQVSTNSVNRDGKELYRCWEPEWICSCTPPTDDQEGILLLLGSGSVVRVDLSGGSESWESGLPDVSCIAYNSQIGTVIGCFEGAITLFGNESKIPQRLLVSETGYAIECMKFTASGEKLIVSTRDGVVTVISFENGKIEIRHKKNIGAIKIANYRDNLFLLYSNQLFLVNIDTFEWRPIDLGNSGAIGHVSVDPTAQLVFAVIPESTSRIVSFSVSEEGGAKFSKSLPFAATSMVAASEGPTTDLYIIGTLEKINRSALFILLLERARIGLIGLNDAVSVSGVLPFNEVREEPSCITIWNHEMFPGSGLVAVGTKGPVRGRIILFDRDSMHAIAKTSVPSTQIHCLCPLSATALVLGCDDCIAILGLKPGPRATTPVVLYTIASFTTYAAILFVTRIDSSRFLIVMDHGLVQLLSLRQSEQSSITLDAVLESPIRIVSACHMIPNQAELSFICSTSVGRINMYRVTPDRPANAGLMPLLSSNFVGGTIVASCLLNDKLLLTLDNGSTIDPDAYSSRLPMQTT
ncbi:hypothetical protein C9890_0139 [Perkinsus sp. BL_2016]|nr:hypothetical protein C9890_0139 [Perkinsus sp. BL_2016]